MGGDGLRGCGGDGRAHAARFYARVAAAHGYSQREALFAYRIRLSGDFEGESMVLSVDEVRSHVAAARTYLEAEEAAAEADRLENRMRALSTALRGFSVELREVADRLSRPRKRGESEF